LTGSKARRLSAGDLEAAFLPGRGMLGASLRRRGVELLRRVDDLEASAASGSTAGIPLLHPWANRLGGLRYRAAGYEVELDPSSPLLHFDAGGLPIHGVSWSRLAWSVTDASADRLNARLDWDRGDLLSVFPFPHRLTMHVTLAPDGLTIETALAAGEEAVPATFGFHPYLAVPGRPRGHWRLELPAMRRLDLDPRGIPTGRESRFEAFDAPLADRAFDDGFALESESARFAISAGGLRISVELLSGYTHAQVYAPPGQDFVALEPMMAPTSALTSGRGVRLVAPGDELPAVFRIRVTEEA
jgi:aldose 1-epimerase